MKQKCLCVLRTLKSETVSCETNGEQGRREGEKRKKKMGKDSVLRAGNDSERAMATHSQMCDWTSTQRGSVGVSAAAVGLAEGRTAGKDAGGAPAWVWRSVLVGELERGRAGEAYLN